MPGASRPSLDTIDTPRAIRVARQRLRRAERVICCAYCEACVCCASLPIPVRGLISIALLEAVCGFCYAIYILVVVTVEAIHSRRELFGAGFLIILASALLLFVWSAVQRENVFELGAANIVSACLCIGPLLIMFRPPEGSGWGEIVELSKSVDQRLRVSFAVIALLFGAAFVGVSALVRREFCWRQFLQYGEEPEKLRLLGRLQLFRCLWKLDVVLCVLCLLAVWAFLFEDWTGAQIFASCVAVFSNLLCSVAIFYAVRLERPRLTLALQPVAALEAIFLLYKSADIVVRKLVREEAGVYEDVWPSVMVPSLLLAALVRVLLMASCVQLVASVFGHGLKGKDPFAKEGEVQLPRPLRRRLRHRRDLQDALRFCIRGQQLKCTGALPAAGPAEGFRSPPLADLRVSFAQLSPSLEQLQLPWLGVSVDMEAVLTVTSHSAAANCPRRGSARGTSSRSSRTSHSCAPTGVGAADADRLDQLGFALWYLEGETPLQMKFVAHDEDALWCWVQGLRTALPERNTVPLNEPVSPLAAPVCEAKGVAQNGL